MLHIRDESEELAASSSGPAPGATARALATVERLRDELVAAVQELVRIPSLTGDEGAAQAFMATLLQRTAQRAGRAGAATTATPRPIRQVLDWIRPYPGLRTLLLAGPAGLWLLLFQAVPLILILVMSLSRRTGTGAIDYSFQLGNYARFVDPLYLGILIESFWVALLVTLATLLVGYPLAYFIASAPAHTRSRWLMLVNVPFWTSMLIRTYAWIFILRGNGLINGLLLKLQLIDQPLSLLYNMGASVLGLAYVLLPFMVLPIYTSVEKLDPSLPSAVGAPAPRRWRRAPCLRGPQSRNRGTVCECL